MKEYVKMRTRSTPPPPRRGMAGIIDRLIGPGATKAELMLQFIIPVPAAIAAPLYASFTVGGWTPLQLFLCGVLAFDTVGGVITNATSTAKRWYHREGQRFTQHIAFVLLHLIHLLVVSWLYLSLDIIWFVISGGYLLLSATVVLTVPRYLQRPIALTAYTGALFIILYLLQWPEGMEWFLPLFYLKLLVSHLPEEEPYRPAQVQ